MPAYTLYTFIYLHIPSYTFIYPYTSKHFHIPWGPTWDLEMAITRAAGRFPRWEFDTMLLSMSQWARHTQKAPKIIQIISFKGSRGRPPGKILLLIRAPIRAWWSAPINAWWTSYSLLSTNQLGNYKTSEKRCVERRDQRATRKWDKGHMCLCSYTPFWINRDPYSHTYLVG